MYYSIDVRLAGFCALWISYDIFYDAWMRYDVLPRSIQLRLCAMYALRLDEASHDRRASYGAGFDRRSRILVVECFRMVGGTV